ncbi:hypothetical protein [Amphibacillus sediminis]|uniref:hypothetical protein n=1 Tax=Amphibacillus sediminis TaxID=360185 RepID=UPI00082CB772|nr:hypothetical protein [Amphibacillus sediminis]
MERWLTIFLLVITGFLLFTFNSNNQTVNISMLTNYQRAMVEKDYNQMRWIDATEAEEPSRPKLTKEKVDEKTTAFMEMLVQETDQNYRVLEITSKAELIKLFDGIASPEVVAPYVDFYYDELEDGLYIVPTELPPWYLPDQSYEQFDYPDGTVVISQEANLDLYGTYKIEITFAYRDDWEIVEIDHPPAEAEQERPLEII